MIIGCACHQQIRFYRRPSLRWTLGVRLSNGFSSDLHRMGFSIEHPAVFPIRIRDLPLGVLVRMNHVCVLEHFGEEEGLLEVSKRATISSIDISDGAVAAADAGRSDDCFEACEGPLDSRRQCSTLKSEDTCVLQAINLHLDTCGRP
jgi:hypothetical protein